MIVTVLGGGNGSLAAIADMTVKGHHVRWWRRQGTSFPQDGLRYRTESGSGQVRIADATHDLATALAGADLILAPIPSHLQPDLLAALARELTAGQAVALTPGTFGTWLGARLRPDVAFFETGTLPYLARVTGPGEVSVPVSASHLPVGSFPATGTLADNAHALFASAYPTAVRLSSGLDAALTNWGPVIHPPLIVHNLGAIESLGDRFDIHAEGSSSAVLQTTQALDAERIALRTALGLPGPHWPLADYYAGAESSMYPPDGKQRLLDSDLWRESVTIGHRYVLEDIRCGLVLNVALAELVGEPAPVGAAIVQLMSAALGEDLRKTGRTPRALGIDNAVQLLRLATGEDLAADRSS